MLQPNDGLLRSHRRTPQTPPVASPASISPAPGTGARFPRPSTTGEAPSLRRYYQRLLNALGRQGWWPARTRLEVILGAILTQNTTWGNAARAIAQLRGRGLLTLNRLRALSAAEFQQLIRPAGFFSQKSRAIHGFLNWLQSMHSGSLDRMFAEPPQQLRAALLELKGVGPETADAILLYAGGKPFFVADAYTRRILARHGLLPDHSGYQEAQEFIHRNLDRDAGIYSEFHALLVEVGKRYCRRSTMECHACPLEIFLPGSADVPPATRLKTVRGDPRGGRDARVPKDRD